MKKLILLTICVIIISCCFAQSNYLPIRDYEDMSTVDKLLKSKYLYKSLLYKPINRDKYSSILLINDGDKIDYWCIKDDSIQKNGCIKSGAIFQYSNYKKTGAVKSESYSLVTFIPPIMMSGIHTEGIIYKDSKMQFYFEYGENITSYKENSKRTKYRKEWLEIIQRELKDIM